MNDNSTNTAKSAVLRPTEITPHERGGGARTIPLVTRKIGSTSLLNGITEFEPEAAIALHTHNCEESVIVLEGSAIAELDGVKYPMVAGDTTWVPANLPHRFINASSTRNALADLPGPPRVSGGHTSHPVRSVGTRSRIIRCTSGDQRIFRNGAGWRVPILPNPRGWNTPP